MTGRRPDLARLQDPSRARVRGAIQRRWFEHQLSRVPLRETSGLVELGSAYGGWIIPGELVGPSWICYTVGAGGDVSFDLDLIRRYGVTVRAFEAVAGYVEDAIEAAGDEPALSVHQAAITTTDGPLRMQVTHDPGSRSVSSSGLYKSREYVELPGRTLPSLMREMGDDHIDLLKLDIEGSEYDVLPKLDLPALGVKVFSVQLHHTGSVRSARELIGQLAASGYEPVACRPVVKITFVQRDLLSADGRR
jgi:FkbM family methyltransferase